MDHFLPFLPHYWPQNLKFGKNVKNLKILWRMVPEILDTVDRVFCHFEPVFALWPSEQPEKSEFWKNLKNTWRYYYFIPVYHKWQSYDVWFLRYIILTDIIFCHFEPFLVFYPTNYPKKQNFEKERKSLDISSFYTCVPQMTNIWYMVLEIWNVTDRFFCHFGLLFHTIFCMFFFLNNPEN